MCKWVESRMITEGVKSSVPEIVSISCPTCGTRHHLPYFMLHVVHSIQGILMKRLAFPV